jgi:hypothetical protein
MKTYRLKKILWFPFLDPKKLYLAHETDFGYTLEIGKKLWIGLPKVIVERSPKVFEIYDPEKHNEARRNKNDNRSNFLNLKKRSNHVPRT